MTKQEKIRAGIADIAEDTWYKHDYDVVWDEVAKAIVAYLHSQGVVIKMDWTVEPLIIAPSDASR